MKIKSRDRKSSDKKAYLFFGVRWADTLLCSVKWKPAFARSDDSAQLCSCRRPRRLVELGPPVASHEWLATTGEPRSIHFQYDALLCLQTLGQILLAPEFAYLVDGVEDGLYFGVGQRVDKFLGGLGRLQPFQHEFLGVALFVELLQGGVAKYLLEGEHITPVH